MERAYCWGAGATVDHDVDFVEFLFYLDQLHDVVLRRSRRLGDEQ